MAALTINISYGNTIKVYSHIPNGSTSLTTNEHKMLVISTIPWYLPCCDINCSACQGDRLHKESLGNEQPGQ